MNILKKVAFKSPLKTTSKRFELSDEWGDYKHRDKIQDGVTFSLKYLGSTLVEELQEEGASYGDKISAAAVSTIVTMAKASKRKLKKVSVRISPGGIAVLDTEDQSVIADLDIYRICFCTADREHGRVFAFIARNKENETMECRAFLCRKRKMAQGVTLAVAESFRIAKELCEMEEERARMMRQPEGSRMVRLLDDLSPVMKSRDIGVKVQIPPITGVKESRSQEKETTSEESFLPGDLHLHSLPLPRGCSSSAKKENRTFNGHFQDAFPNSPLQTSLGENLISL